MILIGERINAGFKDIARAIREKAAGPIQEWARKQAAAGADYIDVNIGAASRDPADMAWLVRVVQEAVPTPISVDSNRPEVLRAGLEVLDGRPALVNSTTADDDKLAEIVPLAVEYGAGLIGVAMDQRGSPQDVERRVENGAKIFIAATEAGLPPDRIFLDPVLMPIRFMQDQAVKVLEAIREYTLLSDPPPHISVGLSNICSKTKERSLITRTFVVMAMAAGLDAAICNVLDGELMAAVATAEVILNKEIYSDDFLKVWALKRTKGGE
ncbi:MAG: dihydropteroate synthase [Caldiserica bacterium]|nr:dihydropteroate synthase [Caldisericota bacterium]